MTTSRRPLRSVAPALAALALAACAQRAAEGPRPARVVPDAGIEGVATAVRVEGEGLSPTVYTDFADGDASRIAARFVLRLGPHSLRDVRAEGGGLAAVVPPDVPPGTYDLLVIDPDGRRGTLERAFRVAVAADLGQLVAGYRFDPVPAQQARAPFEVTVTAVDAAGDAVPAFSGSVALTDVTGTAVPLRIALFAGGRWTGSVEVRAPLAGDVLTATDDRGRTGSSAPFDVAPAPARRVAFSTAALTVEAGACSGEITVELQDAFGVPTVADAATAVGIAPSVPAVFFADAACTTPAAGAAIAAGEGRATLHLRATRAGPLTLTASAAALDASSQVETVVPGPPAAIVFASAPQTVNAGACSQEALLELQDAYGNAVSGPATLVLSEATPSGVTFYADAACAVGASTAEVIAGTSRGSFWFRGTVAQVVTVLADGPGLAGASQDEKVEPEGRASRLVVVTPPRTATAGRCSADPITIQTQDSFGNPVSSAGAVQVTVSAEAGSGVTLFEDALCTVPVSVLAVPAGQSLADLWFSGTLAGAATVAAAGSSLTPAAQDVSVTAAAPSAIAFTTLPQSVAAAACSGAVRLELRDAFGNTSTAPAPVDVALAAAPPTGFALYADATCATPAAAVPVASGAASARFWFRGTKAQDVDVDASAAGLAGATQRETIRPGPAVAIAFTGAAQTIAAGSCSAAAGLELRDASGNAAPAAAPVAVPLASAPAGLAFFSDAACGTPAASLTIAAGAAGTSFFFSGGTAGAYGATASPAGVAPATQDETVVAAAPDRVAFASGPQSVVAGTCSAAVVLEPRDPFGNVSAPASAVAIDLAPSTGGVELFAGAGCSGSAVTSVSLAAGATRAELSFRATIAGPLDLAASPAGLAGATQRETVVAAAADRLAFSTPPRTVAVGQCSPAVTVEARDPWGNVSPVAAAATVSIDVSPASASFLFFSDASCTAPVTAVQIAAGQSAATFHFLETAAGDRTVGATSSPLTAASQLERVLSGGPAQLVFTRPPWPPPAAPASVVAGTCSPVLWVETRDAYGNDAVVGAQTSVALAGGGLALYSDPGCGTASSSYTLAAGTGNTNLFMAPATATDWVKLYARGTAAGAYTVTASAAALSPATAAVAVVAAPPDRLAYTSAAKTVTAGTCSGAVTLESRDAWGNRSAPAADTAVSIAPAPSTGFALYAGGSCAGDPVSSFTLPSGSTALTVSFRATVAGSVTLTATGAGLGGPAAVQVETVQPGAASQIVFVTGAQTVAAGACSTVVVLETRDANGNVTAVPGGATIDLAVAPATGFSFYAGAGCSGGSVTHVHVAAGASQTTFSFMATVIGQESVTVNSAGYTSPAPQVETIVAAAPDHLAFTTLPQTLGAGACSAVAKVESMDRFGNRSGVAADAAVALSAAPAAGFGFYSDPNCTIPISSVLLTAGQIQTSFYFAGTAAGTIVVTASAAAAGIPGPATQNETIRAGAAVSLRWDTIASPQALDVAFAVRVTARDSYGNVVPSFTGMADLSAAPGGVAVTCRSSCSTASRTDAFVSGAWTGSVSVSPGATGVVLAAASGAISGTSSAFDVQAPTGRSPPCARISATPVVLKAGGTVSFDASASTDYETAQALLQVSWDFEGSSSSPSSTALPPDAPWTAWTATKTASHAYATSGTYYARVAVKDAAGDVGYAIVTIVVLPSSTTNLCVVTTNLQTDDGASSCAGPYGADGKLSLPEAVRLAGSMSGTATITFSGPMTISGATSYTLSHAMDVVAPPGVVLDGQSIDLQSTVLFSGVEMTRLSHLHATGGTARLRDVYLHDSTTLDVDGTSTAYLERVRMTACRSGSTVVDCIHVHSESYLALSHSELRGSGTNTGVWFDHHHYSSTMPRISSTVFTGFGTAVRTDSGEAGPVLAYCTFDANATAVAGPGQRLISNVITGSTIEAVNCAAGSYASRESQLLHGNASEGCIAGDVGSAGTMTGDPLYILPSAWDYRLSFSSPAKDSGQSAWIDAQGSLFDLNGPAPGLYFGAAADRGGRETW